MLLWYVLLLALVFSSGAKAQQSSLVVIGEIALAKGVVTARSDQRDLSALAKGSPVYLGDIIETATRSFTVIKFNDGGKITLRPDSRFDINEYEPASGQEKQSFELVKGGLRAVTGAIAKSKPQQVQYVARNTTIGIRGTEFVIVDCKKSGPNCDYQSDGTDLPDEETRNKFVDIYIVDKDGGQRRKITRRELNEILNGVYVAIISGAIRLTTEQGIVDLGAGEKCVVDQNIDCFLNTTGLEDKDVYVSDEAEILTLFDVFDENTFAPVGSEICEID